MKDDIEKKLDALIDALGFDVKITEREAFSEQFSGGSLVFKQYYTVRDFELIKRIDSPERLDVSQWWDNNNKN